MVGIIVAISALFVYYDATENNVGKIPDEKGFTNISAGAWAASTLLCWIIVFPLYLFKRKALIEKAKDRSPNPPHKVAVFTVLGIVLALNVLALNTVVPTSAIDTAKAVGSASAIDTLNYSTKDIDVGWKILDNKVGIGALCSEITNRRASIIKKGTADPYSNNALWPAYMVKYTWGCYSPYTGDTESTLYLSFATDPRSDHIDCVTWRGPNDIPTVNEALANCNFKES